MININFHKSDIFNQVPIRGIIVATIIKIIKNLNMLRLKAITNTIPLVIVEFMIVKVIKDRILHPINFINSIITVVIIVADSIIKIIDYYYYSLVLNFIVFKNLLLK